MSNDEILDDEALRRRAIADLPTKALPRWWGRASKPKASKPKPKAAATPVKPRKPRKPRAPLPPGESGFYDASGKFVPQ